MYMMNLEYFEWLCELVNVGRVPKDNSYRELLRQLYETPFRWLMIKDENRAQDGIALRHRFNLYQGYSDEENDIYFHDVPCSVLEMMIGLAVRCEENIMDNPDIGNRTSQWFWGMISSLGLNDMYGAFYDKRKVDKILITFMNRNYRHDGKGGLFTIKHCQKDLRDVEIWVQLMWYLDSLLGDDKYI